MKTVIKVGFLVLFLALFLLNPNSVSAQHLCACTPTCSRSCTLPSCNGTCNTACAIGSVAPLTYSGNGLVIALDWEDATNSTAYELIVRNSSGAIVLQQSALTVSNSSFTAIVGETYSWTVRAYSWCRNGSAVAGPAIGIPSAGSVILAYGVGGECTDSNCNGEDMIVGLDQNYNQQVPVRVTTTDSNGGGDIQYLYVLLDNNMDYSDGSLLRIKYTNDGSPDGILEIENAASPNNSKYSEISIYPESYERTISGNNLGLNFTLDFSSLNEENFFLTNIYTNTRDFTNIGTGRVLKIGTGDTEEKPADPYTGNAVNALDVWNGKDVAVKNVGFYQTSYENICSQAGSWQGFPVFGLTNLEAIYSPTGDWLSPLTNWDTIYQPYYYYNNTSNEITYTPTNDASIILTGMSAAQYGGECVEDVDGAVTNNFKNGGVREEDSGVGNASLETAFSVIEVSGSWSKIIDGSLYSGANFDLNIEPLTCLTVDCVLMDVLNSDNNGLLLVNGDITAKETVNYGKIDDWYAKTQDGKNPFNNLEIDKDYDEIKGLFAEGTFTELTTDSTIFDGQIGGIDLGPNQTYFVNGNLIINDDLDVLENNYLLFVVNGNLTIDQGVKSTEGMFIVFGDIIVQDNEADYNDALNIEGALVASGSIDFGRSLYINNNTTPAVTVRFRPDMLGKMAAEGIGIIDLQTNIVGQL